MKVVIIMSKNNVFNMIKFNLKVNRNSILGWAITIFVLMFIYMVMFPTIKDIGIAKMEVMPEEMLKFVGLTNITDMSNYNHYFGMIFNMILIVISVFAVTFSARLICKEEKTKSIEFLNSLNVSRQEIYVSKLITAFLAITLVLLAGVIAALIAGLISGGDTFIFNEFIKMIKISSISVYFFFALSFLISGISAKISVGTISSIAVFGTYMIGYLGVLLEKKWLTYFSPFESFSPQNALSLNNYLLYIIYFIFLVSFIVVGGKFYCKRDLNI